MCQSAANQWEYQDNIPGKNYTNLFLTKLMWLLAFHIDSEATGLDSLPPMSRPPSRVDNNGRTVIDLSAEHAAGI